MKLLEMTETSLVVRTDAGEVDLLPRNAYTELRYSKLDGRPIRYKTTNGKDTILAVELPDSRGFECTLNGKQIAIPDKVWVGEALLAHHEGGGLARYASLWRLFAGAKRLGISLVRADANVVLEGSRLTVPAGVDADLVESMEGRRGCVLYKAHFLKQTGEPDGRDYGIFDSGHGVAVALIGRDESRDPWMRIVPPEYAVKSLWDADLWTMWVDGDAKNVIVVSTSLTVRR